LADLILAGGGGWMGMRIDGEFGGEGVMVWVGNRGEGVRGWGW